MAALAVTPDLFNMTNRRTLGLPLLQPERARVYTAVAGCWTFSHTPNLAVFDDTLYLMWMNGIEHEDSAGQRILYATSTNGVDWSTPAPLMTPDMMSDDPKGALMSSGWHVHGDTLTAYATYSTGSYADRSLCRLWGRVSHDGQHWDAPVPLVTGTFLEGPKPTGDGGLVLLGQGDKHRLIVYRTDSADGLTGWTPATVTEASPIPSVWPEPALLRRPDGSLVATIRHGNSDGTISAAESRDGGRTWVADRTSFPDAQARMSAGRLPDGRCFLVSNPSFAAQRGVMAISLSADGYLFDRAYALLIDPPALKFPGNAKFAGWQYPNALVWHDALYVAYSIGKEDIEVARLTLDQLAG